MMWCRSATAALCSCGQLRRDTCTSSTHSSQRVQTPSSRTRWVGLARRRASLSVVSPSSGYDLDCATASGACRAPTPVLPPRSLQNGDSAAHYATAHVGVLRVLLDRGVPPDAVGSVRRGGQRLSMYLGVPPLSPFPAAAARLDAAALCCLQGQRRDRPRAARPRRRQGCEGRRALWGSARGGTGHATLHPGAPSPRLPRCRYLGRQRSRPRAPSATPPSLPCSSSRRRRPPHTAWGLGRCCCRAAGLLALASPTVDSESLCPPSLLKSQHHRSPTKRLQDLCSTTDVGMHD